MMGHTEAGSGLASENDALASVTEDIRTDDEMRYRRGTHITCRVQKYWESVSDGHSIGKQPQRLV
jgi:hypothetical protein